MRPIQFEASFAAAMRGRNKYHPLKVRPMIKMSASSKSLRVSLASGVFAGGVAKKSRQILSPASVIINRQIIPPML
jgi:hypothetical protein